MGMLIGLALIAVAYFLLVSGMQFLALLVFAVAVLLILTRSTDAKTAAGGVNITEPFGKEGPIVVENKMPDMPPRISFKIHPDWEEFSGFEYDLFNLGWVTNNFGHFFYNLFTGSHKKGVRDSD